MKETILSLPTPFGGPLELSRFFWGDPAARQSLAIVSGLHGNQLNGIYLTSRLIHFFDEITAGKIPGSQLTGKVNIIPAVNLNALPEGNRMWTYDQLDMDLAFPGSTAGEPSERIAQAVLEHTLKSKYGLILGTAPDHYEDAPHTAYLNSDGSAKDMARSLGLNLARELNEQTATKLTLFNHWVEGDTTAVILSLGTPGSIDQPRCDAVFDKLLEFMRVEGILSPKTKPENKRNVEFYAAREETVVKSTCAGLFLPAVRAGDWLREGDKIGEIRDIHNGKSLADLIAPKEGWLVRLRRYPTVYEREPIAHMLIRKRRWFWPFGGN